MPRNSHTSSGVMVLALLCGALHGCGGSQDPPAGRSPDQGQVPDSEAAGRRAPEASPEVARAERLLANGDVEEAQAVLEAVIENHPDDARAHLDLGLVFEERGDSESAERAYRSALSAEAEFPEALNNLGLLLRVQDRHVEAIEHLQRAVRAQPEFAEAHLNLALALEDHGQPTEAAHAYREVVRLAPRDALAWINLGLVTLELGDVDQAVAYLRRGLPLARGDAGLLLAAGNGLRRAGQFGTAVRAMEMAVEAHADPTPALLSELALAQRASGDRAAAAATLQGVLAAHPEYATAHYLLGNLLAGQRDFRGAIEHYRRYLGLEPRGPHAEAARERLGVARRLSRAQ